MTKRQHRWENSLSESQIGLLKETAKQLHVVWKHDMKNPDLYPFNTDYVFCSVMELLRGESTREISEFLPPRKPLRFFDLVSERQIKLTYEDHNRGSYEDALEQASEGGLMEILYQGE